MASGDARHAVGGGQRGQRQRGWLLVSGISRLCLCHARIARVIGKRGRTIAEVRSKSGAWNVDARDQEEDPCQVKVTGPAEAVKKARDMILELSRPMSERFSDRVFVEISQGQIGKVVGSKGARIQEIERQTGVKIDIDYSCAPCRVFLTGSESQVRLTKRLLQEIAS